MRIRRSYLCAITRFCTRHWIYATVVACGLLSVAVLLLATYISFVDMKVYLPIHFLTGAIASKCVTQFYMLLYAIYLFTFTILLLCTQVVQKTICDIRGSDL